MSISFFSSSPVFSHTITHASSLASWCSGVFLTLSFPPDTVPGGRASPSLLSPPVSPEHPSTRGPQRAPSRLCFWMGCSSVENDRPSSCFNQCFSRPWSDVNSLVKALQLCPLHTPFLSPYDPRKSLVHRSASLLRLRAFWTVFPSAFESPQGLVKTVDSALRCVCSDSARLGWCRRFCISLSFQTAL